MVLVTRVEVPHVRDVVNAFLDKNVFASFDKEWLDVTTQALRLPGVKALPALCFPEGGAPAVRPLPPFLEATAAVQFYTEYFLAEESALGGRI